MMPPFPQAMSARIEALSPKARERTAAGRYAATFHQGRSLALAP